MADIHPTFQDTMERGDDNNREFLCPSINDFNIASVVMKR